MEKNAIDGSNKLQILKKKNHHIDASPLWKV